MSFGLQHFGIVPLGSSDPLGGAEGHPPLIFNWRPLIDSQIGRLALVGCDVTSDVGLADVVVRAIQSGGASEVVFDSGAAERFSPNYRRGSVAAVITGGLRLVVRRTGGWPSSEFRLHVVARDLAGRSTVGQAFIS